MTDFRICSYYTASPAVFDFCPVTQGGADGSDPLCHGCMYRDIHRTVMDVRGRARDGERTGHVKCPLCGDRLWFHVDTGGLQATLMCNASGCLCYIDRP